MLKAKRVKKCRVCKNDFKVMSGTQVACSMKCALFLAKEKDKKKSKKALVEFRKNNKPKSKLIAEAQAAVNKYIRERDFGRPCICCGEPINWNGSNTVDAGHYRSRGRASHLRFNLFNIHAQRKVCNQYGFDIVRYRQNLIEKIGVERVRSLESNNNERRYSKEYLERIKVIFNKRARFYKKRRSNKSV